MRGLLLLLLVSVLLLDVLPRAILVLRTLLLPLPGGLANLLQLQLLLPGVLPMPVQQALPWGLLLVRRGWTLLLPAAWQAMMACCWALTCRWQCW